MTAAECMRILGLSESASADEIKRAYRRLALELHPDRNRDDAAARQRFAEVSTAYRILMAAARAVRDGKPIGTCRDCGQFGEVATGTDGRIRCRRCLYGPRGGRLLPLPMFVVVRCVGTVVILAVGVYLITAACVTGERPYAIGAFFAGLVGMAALAHTCLSVVHCLQPAERRQKRRAQDRP